MKKLLVLAAAAAVLLSACNTGGTAKPKTAEDSMAYYIGAVTLGPYLHQLDSTVNLNMVMSGIKAYFADQEAVNKEEAYAFLNNYFMVVMPAKQKKASEDFLAQVEKDTKDIQKTASGLLYVIENPGNDVKATSDSSMVSVVYHGTLPNGKVFDSSRDQGDTVTFGLNQVIPAWTEGMKLIGEGGKIKLWVPSDLAYGETGSQGGPIGPNQAIIFEVELVKVMNGGEE